MIPSAQPYILIGMHRSGTSMLAELLHSSGIFMGNDREKNSESVLFQRINDELLRQAGFSWANPGVPAASKAIKLSTLRVVRRFIVPQRNPVEFARLMRGKPWGWKDPRNTFTLDHWLKIFPEAKMIHIYRNGMDVALSLYHRNLKRDRNSGSYQKVLETKAGSLDLWEKYVAQAFSFEPRLGARMLTLQFEKIIASDAEEVRKLEQFTGLSLHGKIVSMADQTRTARYQQGEHDDLVEYAQKSVWMKKLGYVGAGQFSATR